MSDRDPINGQHSPIPLMSAPPLVGPPHDEKDNKKGRKKRRREEKRRQDLLDRFPPTPPASGLGAQPSTSPRNREWLRPAFRLLSSAELVVAHKANALIGINCLMLSIGALAVYRGADAGQLWWALIPLALTNLLSMLFAILGAQERHLTSLDELCAMPEEDFDQALETITADREHVYRSLRHDVRLVGQELGRRQQHLRTAYNVLLGGVPLSIFVLGVSVAVSSGA